MQHQEQEEWKVTTYSRLIQRVTLRKKAGEYLYEIQYFYSNLKNPNFSFDIRLYDDTVWMIRYATKTKQAEGICASLRETDKITSQDLQWLLAEFKEKLGDYNKKSLEKTVRQLYREHIPRREEIIRTLEEYCMSIEKAYREK